MKEWMHYRETFLDSLMGAEFPCDQCHTCVRCNAKLETKVKVGENQDFSKQKTGCGEELENRAIRCDECNSGPLCVKCALHLHDIAPLHVLKASITIRKSLK